ncbi:glycosyltransferase [Sphingomonas sp. I4]
MVICVPARDEVAMLPGLLSAIAALSVERDRLSLCLYLDDCRDGSGALLDRLASSLNFRLIVARGGDRGTPNAGAARRAALAMGLDLLAGGEGALFTTDADSQPGRDWIAAGISALARAEVAAGRIVRRDAAADPQQCRIEAYYDRLHRHRRIVDPVPWEACDTHHFSGGANIAIRASAYRTLGGIQPLSSGRMPGCSTMRGVPGCGCGATGRCWSKPRPGARGGSRAGWPGCCARSTRGAAALGRSARGIVAMARAGGGAGGFRRDRPCRCARGLG